jgi:hypothetical protein
MALGESFNKHERERQTVLLVRSAYMCIQLRFNLPISDHYFCPTGCNYNCTSDNHIITQTKLSYRNVGSVQYKIPFFDKLKLNYFDPIFFHWLYSPRGPWPFISLLIYHNW